MPEAENTTPETTPATSTDPQDAVALLENPPDPTADVAVGSEAAAQNPESLTEQLPSVLEKGPSPIQRLDLRPRTTPDAAPLSLTFLTGPYASQSLKLGETLGMTITELTISNGAEWSARKGDRIRGGFNFDRLSARTFDISTQLWVDNGFDISHLSENLGGMFRMGADDESPALLLLKAGAIRARVFCTKVDSVLKEPYAGEGGFKLAEISMSFTLDAGGNTEFAQGQELAPTPLQDWRSSLTAEEQRLVSQVAAVENSFAPCLGEEGSDQVEALVQAGKLNDVEALLELEGNALVQSAIAGLIPPSVLRSDPRLQQRLEESLALVIAENEDGIGAVDSESPRAFAQALLDPTRHLGTLSTQLQIQAQEAQADFQLISKAIFEQSLNEDSEIFKEGNRRAAERLRASGSCGLQLRAIGGPDIPERVSAEDSQTLQDLTTILQDPDFPDGQIRGVFYLSSESQIRRLREIGTFSSKEDFIQKYSEITQGGTANGYAAWEQFKEFNRLRREDIERQKQEEEKQQEPAFSWWSLFRPPPQD